MIWIDHTQTIISIFIAVPGIVGNILIYMRYVYNFLIGPDRKPIDLILNHFAFSNILLICNTVISGTTTLSYFKNSLGNAGCKVVLFLGRMARGLSICTACLLSMVQAVTINPRTIWWRKLRPQTAWQFLPYLLSFWIINSLISSNLLYYITAVSSVNRSGVGMYVGFCLMQPSRLIVRWLFICLMALRDVIFQGLMGWSSASMALHLYKHHKRVLYLHSYKCVNNSSPEIRATWSTLILMTCFLCFYWIDFIFSFYMGSIVAYDHIIIMIKPFIQFGYAVLSPFVLVSKDVHVAKSPWQRGRGPEELTPQAGGTAESIRARWASLHPEALRTPVTIAAVTRFAPRRGPGRADEERGDETPFQAPRAARGEAELRASAHRPAAPLSAAAAPSRDFWPLLTRSAGERPVLDTDADADARGGNPRTEVETQAAPPSPRLGRAACGTG
uniref:vomeronasal type-1 receptor 4-like n=1 Tax=Jaculus jaculus TaxID=51337 RepID=UPI001E1B4DD7|nr:vomeronasal type-1 receptor 4-like [Jaculus jaculus]